MTKILHRAALSLSAIAIGAAAWMSAPSFAQDTVPATVQAAPPSFNSVFSDLGAANVRPQQASDAVDLDSFKPKRELPPKPKPKPKPKTNPKSASYGGVVRSLGTVVASYYGKRFHGRLTANGERFNMNAMTAPHKTLPFGT
ncbi:MAG: septal ring lytic transglycosylase RlpA family protein, partial [Marinomonas sp.]